MSALSLYNRPSQTFDAKVAHSIALLQRVASGCTALAQASSLGVEDMAVTQLVHLAGLQTSIFVLETGQLHPQTLAMIPKIERRYGRSVAVFKPNPSEVIRFVRQHGEQAMFESVALRKGCCEIRKMEPLQRALQGKDGWITGLRREQSHARAEVVEVEQEAERVKLSPLADWTWGDVWHFVALHQLDYNPLHDEFFPSIGCAPCTRAIAVGEDFRAGRWWWEQAGAKECGLHLSPSSPLSPPTEKAEA